MDNKTAMQQLVDTTAADKKKLVEANRQTLQRLKATTTAQANDIIDTNSKAMAATYEGLMHLVALINATTPAELSPEV